MRHFVPCESKDLTPISLQARLGLYGISTIPPDEVERYKLKKLAEMPRANTLGEIASLSGRTASEMAYFCDLVVFCMCMLCLVWCAASVAGTIFMSFVWLAGTDYNYVPVSFLSIFASFLCMWLCARLGTAKLTIRTTAYWMRVSWKMHSGATYSVPAAISARVRALRPFCGLSVLELTQDEVLFDPILIAFDPNTGEEHFVGIWDGDQVIA